MTSIPKIMFACFMVSRASRSGLGPKRVPNRAWIGILGTSWRVLMLWLKSWVSAMEVGVPH